MTAPTPKPLSDAMVAALRLARDGRYEGLFKHSEGKWGAYPRGTAAVKVEGSASPLTVKALEKRGLLRRAFRSLYAHNDPRMLTAAGHAALAELDEAEADAHLDGKDPENDEEG